MPKIVLSLISSVRNAGAWLFASVLFASPIAFAQLDFTASTPIGNAQLNDVHYANGQYVMVGGTQTGPGVAAFSADGVTWQPAVLPGGSGLTAVSFGTDTWVAVGYAGTVLTSPDGMNWTLQSSGLSPLDHILDVTCSSDRFRGPVCVMAGQGEAGGSNDQMLLYRSTNRGVSWSRELSTPTANRLAAADFAKGYFLVAGDQDTILRGVDNRGRFIWTVTSSGAASTEHQGMTFGNGNFVSVGRNASTVGVGEISMSDDALGDSWVRLASTGTDELSSIAFGDDLFVAVGRNGTVISSALEARNWSPASSGVTEHLNGVTIGGGQVIAVGDAGTVVRSASNVPILPVAAGTVRDNPVDGVADVLDSDPTDGGFFGPVTNSTSFVDVFVAEFDLTSIAGSIDSAALVFNISGFNSGAPGSTLNLQRYTADGQITLTDFAPGGATNVANITLPGDLRSWQVLSVDVTADVTAATGSSLGFMFSLQQTAQISVGASDIEGNLSVPRLLITPSTNEPPAADAGPDQSVRAPATVQLAGSAFDDNTAAIDLVYNWTIVSAPPDSLAMFANAMDPATTIGIDLPGIYELQLTATDTEGAVSAPDTVLIGTNNLAPTADAGPDQMALTGALVSFDGSNSSDPESDPLSFSWALIAPGGSTAILTNANTAIPAFVPDIAGTYEAVLTVSDAGGSGTPDSAIVVVSTPGDFAQAEIQQADTAVTSLESTEVTTSGNQNALSNFLMQSTSAIQEGDTSEAVDKLDKASVRTDGCIERGSPDGNGPGRDWITTCEAQMEVYEPIDSARQALTQ